MGLHTMIVDRALADTEISGDVLLGKPAMPRFTVLIP